jgi:hypothetical protein
MTSIIDLTGGLGLYIRHENLHLHGQTGGSDVGLDGREQVTYSENRRWQGEIVFPPMDQAQALAMRSVGTRLRGRVGRLRLPVLNLQTPSHTGDDAAFWASLGVSAADIAAGAQSFSDGSFFSDGTGFALPDGADPTLSDDLAAGVTQVTIDTYMGKALQVGDRFSIDGFLYEVEDNNDGVIDFAPPLRTAASSGDVVKISQPEIVVRLAQDDGWRPFLDMGFTSREMTVSVVEAFDR